MIYQVQNAKSIFLRFSIVHALQKTKYKSGVSVYTFSKNLCLNSQFKNGFQQAFLIKVFDTKKYTTCT